MASARAEELLRQILANPDDDAPRAVYADELQAQGDPRGEFIALELAGDPAHAARRASLLGAHAATWWPGLGRHRVRTRGGFLDRVAADAGDLAAAREVFAREPVRHVELVDAHDATIPLIEPAWQAHLSSFTARGFLQDVRALVRAPLGARIEALDLGGCHLDRDLPALGDDLPACRALRLGGNLYLGRHMPKLLAWRHLGNVEVLDLCHDAITPELLEELLALDLHSLRELRLSGNPIGNRGPQLIADALPRMPALERVTLHDADLDPPVLDPLGGRAVIHVPRVIAIDLVGFTIELVHVTADRWAIRVDGRQRTIRSQHVRRDDDREPRIGPWEMAEHAPLDRLAAALASGMPRVLTPDGCSVGLRAETGYVYNTSVYSSETVRIACSPSAATVAVTFDEYVSID